MTNERSELEIRAIAFAQARTAKTMARKERERFQCSVTDVETPPCWVDPGGDRCDECEKRDAAHKIVVQRSAAATAALRALKRAVGKVAGA